MRDPLRYWATAGLVEGDDPQDVVEEIRTRWREYREDAERCGQLGLWVRARRFYYGQDAGGGHASSHYLTVDGEQDERITVRSNHLRSLARRLLIMATETRPAFEVTTINDSPKSMNEAQLGQLLIDYYLDDGSLEQTCRRVAEKALLDSRAYLHAWWDPMKGDAAQPDPNAPGEREIRAGDLVYEDVSAYEVARDVRAPAALPMEWAVVRRWVNKWTLAARYPERAQEIIAAECAPETTIALWGELPQKSADWVPLLVLYHEQTDALPQGRHVEVLGDVVIYDGPLTYERIPLIEMTPTTLADTSWGYSDVWDLFGLQEGYDAAVSACLSQQRAVAHANLLVAKAQQVDAIDIAKGLRKIEYLNDGNAPPPSWLSPPPLPESALKLRDLMKDDLEINSGVNSVARGAESGASGAQDALTQSMAVQYAGGLIGTYAILLREAAAHTIRLLQVFAKAPRMAEIAGSSEMPAVRQFSGQDLASIRNVRVELAAPETRTVAGRDAMAKELVQLFPEQVSVEQYLAFKTTGRWQPMVQRAASEIRLIREENDHLATGAKPVFALAEDNHALHVAEHNVVLHSCEARADNELVRRVAEHIKAHREMMAPPPLPGDEMALAGGPGGQPPTGAEPAGVKAEPPMPQGGQQPGRMPRMPTNPATGEQPAPNGAVQMEG